MQEIRKGKTIKIAWPKKTTQEAWLELRAKMSGEGDEDLVRLGASEVSVATGSNTFQCPQRLFHKLTGFHKKDFINEILVGGHLLEPVIAKRWEGFVVDDMETSLKNSLNGIVLNSIKKAEFFLLNSAYPYLSVSLDYVPKGTQHSPWTGEKYPPLTPHEFKSSNEQYVRLWPTVVQGDRKFKIARPYLEQINIQMLVSNTKLAVFHLLVDGRHYSVVEVERDDELLAEILPKIESFVENAKKGKRLVRMMRELLEAGETEESEMFQTYKAMYDEITPDAVGIDDNLDLVYEIHGETTKESDQFKTATDRDNDLMYGYLAQNAIIKAADSEKIRLRTMLVESCGQWQGVRGEGIRMVNRRANPDTGKKAYFDIREFETK